MRTRLNVRYSLLPHLNTTNNHLNMLCLSTATMSALSAKRCVSYVHQAVYVLQLTSEFLLFSLIMEVRQDVLNRLHWMINLIQVNWCVVNAYLMIRLRLVN